MGLFYIQAFPDVRLLDNVILCRFYSIAFYYDAGKWLNAGKMSKSNYTAQKVQNNNRVNQKEAPTCENS